MRRRTAKQLGLRNAWHSGDDAYYEYHCDRSHNSADAPLWYRSHQSVKVLAQEEPGIGSSLEDRAEEGAPRVYSILFKDGFRGVAFEDELFIHPEYWDPNYGPPKK